MKYKTCPVCDLDVLTGSHWDCVFSLLEEWVAHRKEEEREVKPAAGEDLRVDLGEAAPAPAPVMMRTSETVEREKNG